MTNAVRRTGSVLTWIVVSTAMGCLVAALMRGGLEAPSLWPAIVAAVRHEGVFILAVVTLSTLVGAVLGDLPGLRHSLSFATFVAADEDGEGARGWMSRESLALAAVWLALCFLMRWAWPLPEGVWYLFSLFGMARCIQLGNHLQQRRLQRQAG
jgi:hypothetical protein